MMSHDHDMEIVSKYLVLLIGSMSGSFQAILITADIQ